MSGIQALTPSGDPGGHAPAASRADCEARDRDDPFRPLRDDFLLPDRVIYLDGNSLGPLSRAVRDRVRTTVESEWAKGLIRSWNDADWYTLPRRVGARIAALIGAAADEVVVADSTSINLFKALSTALQISPDRRVIVSERSNFPTDLYIAEGIVRWLGAGYALRLVEKDEIVSALDHDTAVLLLTEVDYRNGARHPMAPITAAAQRAGAVVVWDLAHSAGAFPVDLNGANADFAIGCGYKYLNGGPGAPAFLFVARRHQNRYLQPLSGWMGHMAPFAFDPRYQPADGIERYLCGTPSVIAMSALDAALDLFARADAFGGLAGLHRKAQRLTSQFVECVERDARAHGLQLISPRAAEARGNQVSFAVPDAAQAYALMQALIADGVIGDFRAPDVLRFGFSPMYLRHVDAWDAARVLIDVLDTGRWRAPEFMQRRAVT